MNKAVFLDRDGTINYDYDHVFDPDRISLLPGVADAIASLKKSGYVVIIVTNQSCVGRGYTTIDQVIKTNDRLCELLLAENTDAKIDDIQIAPEHPSETNNRRKPSPRMIEDCLVAFNLTPKSCWIIGDRESDCLSGIHAAFPREHCLLVKKNQVEDIISDFIIFESLSEASKHILISEKNT